MASDDRFIQVGSEIVIANLGQSKPFVTFPGGHGSETQKVYDNTLLVVLFSVSDAGSTETLYLNQKEKTFRLVEDIDSIPDLKTMIIDGKLKLS